MQEILIRDAYHVATLDDAGTRLGRSDILVRDGRIAAVGPGLGSAHPPAPGTVREVIDARRCIALPGFVNTHHHLFQTMTRNAPVAQNAKLFDWLAALYPTWKYLEPETVFAGTLVGAAELLLTGCTTTTDHHYLFPQGAPAELLDAQFAAAEILGIRTHFTRGSMSMGESRGGMPPDSICQDEDAILRDCERVLDRHHDPRPGSLKRVALAPCAPFSVSEELMRATVRLARSRGVHCHTHLAETEDENVYCQQRYGCRPLELMERWEWLGPDVWFAHGIHFNALEIATLARTGTGIAHCPVSNMRLASGIPSVPAMLRAGVTVGLGVDGSSSNDSSDMLGEVRQAMLLARIGHGPDALTAEAALRLATRGGAALLGRGTEIGSLETGKAADLVLFDLSGVDRAGALSDPLAALVFTGVSHRAHTVLVGGRVVVRDGRLATADETEVARRAHEASFRLFARAGVRLPWGTPPWLEPAPPPGGAG